eukprot:COSAG03_NODE_2797_length_2447_cov_210.560477_2_plen_244_part_00
MSLTGGPADALAAATITGSSMARASVCLSPRASVCMSVCLSVCLSACLPAWLSVCLSFCLSVSLSVVVSQSLACVPRLAWRVCLRVVVPLPARAVQAGASRVHALGGSFSIGRGTHRHLFVSRLCPGSVLKKKKQDSSKWRRWRCSGRPMGHQWAFRGRGVGSRRCKVWFGRPLRRFWRRDEATFEATSFFLSRERVRFLKNQCPPHRARTPSARSPWSSPSLPGTPATTEREVSQQDGHDAT